jgi:diaminopimelate epimerase
MGNPHAVIFVDDPKADLRAMAETLGPTLEVAATFPRRTNVEFARVRDGEIDLVVWERGCGITLACGTGACATAVAAGLEGRLPFDRETPVHLPGGTLFITARGDLGGVRMRGPAKSVFSAEVDLGALMADRPAGAS